MNSIRQIRDRLQMTQAALAAELSVTQGNVSHYENGQGVPQLIARRLIEIAEERGVQISFDDIYEPASQQKEVPAEPIAPCGESGSSE